MTEKLQKVLARAGYGSRRLMESWIAEGRVKINNTLAKLGDRVSQQDSISLDGRPVPMHRLTDSANRTLMYHKNTGSVCSRSDPEGRRTVFEDMPELLSGRWISVGRLDITTTGLLLMTTDGELANRLMHPSYQLEREYLVRVLGAVSKAALAVLTTGVELDDGPAKFDSIIDAGGEGANHWYRVVVREGRYREVRRLWESQGIQVSRLSRIRFGPVILPRSLRRGQCEEVPAKILDKLYQSVDLQKPEQAGVNNKPTTLRSKVKNSNSKPSSNPPGNTKFGKSAATRQSKSKRSQGRKVRKK